MEDLKIDELDYRGIHLDFYNDDNGQSVYCYWDGSLLNFGTYNSQYKEDAKYLIDNKLDTIASFGNNCYLKWFTNGFSECKGVKLTNGHFEYRDIKLEYRSRIVKIWPVNDVSKVDIDAIIKEAKKIAEKLNSY